jgi:hypothetical protein
MLVTEYIKGDVLSLNNVNLGAAKTAGDVVAVNGEVRIVPADVVGDLNTAYFGNTVLPTGTALYRGLKAASVGIEFAEGDNVYWDATAGKFTSVALGNTFAGIASAASVDADTYVIFRHCGKGAEGPHVKTVASAGSSQTDAAALTGLTNIVTGADGTKGVKLPAAAATVGKARVYNAVATNGLKIYPASGDTINGGSADAAITIEGKTLAILECLDGTNWGVSFVANT